jgi:hypothetical protein
VDLTGEKINHSIISIPHNTRPKAGTDFSVDLNVDWKLVLKIWDSKGMYWSGSE